MRLTAVMAPALKYCFDTMINLKQNNLNLGETIYLKSWTELLLEKRLVQ